MGFPAASTRPTSFDFLLSSSELTGRDWRTTLVTSFLAAARTEILRLLTSVPTDSASFRELEERLHVVVGRCLDLVTAGIVKAAHSDERVLETVALLMQTEPHLRLQSSHQTSTITFLGGSRLQVASPYFLRRPPRGRGRPRGRGKRGKSGNGLYPVLAILGIHNRATPALTSEVALQLSCTTVEQAQAQLRRRGIELNRKRLTSVVSGLGSRALRFREQVIGEGRASQLGDVTGCRIVIGTDGGRLRTRVQKKRGRKKPNGRRGFKTAWREPKVLVVYEIDNDGRRQRKCGFRYYDATLGDADAAFKLLAGLLRSVRAWRAREWIIVGDGAPWIWERVGELIKAVGYSREKVTEVVDLYHARQRLHAFADEVKSFSERQKTRWLNKMRGLLDQGRIRDMETEFSIYFKGCNSKKPRKIAAYFSTHANRMAYARYRRMAIPLGSGAVESCVRRLVNLRLKGNGIFWTETNAEQVLHLRGQYLAGRWNEFVDRILQPITFWNQAETSNAL